VESEDDQLVMYLVVRRRTTRPFAELATAGALAARRCAYRFGGDERWRGRFEEWRQHSFRKVCLRAEPRDWDDLRALDHERVGDVACLPPIRRSERVRVLVRMQTLSDEAGALPEIDTGDLHDLTLVVATDLGMSSGKTIAQIGHAALLADLELGPDKGLDLSVVGAGGPRWAEIVGSAETVVRDGGLTEIASGSETVLVLRRPPGARS
jgi:peptidyl-tRNA hydrolase